MYRFMSYEEVMNIVKNPTNYTKYEIRCAKFHLINHIWRYKHHVKAYCNDIWNYKRHIKEYIEYVKKLDGALK